MGHKRIPARYYRIDGWRGFMIPGAAVAGASDTGGWEDSPCPTRGVRAEIDRLRKEVLRPAGITSRVRTGRSSNVFCAKRWVVVSPDEWPLAKELVDDWLAKHERELRYLHDANGKG